VRTRTKSPLVGLCITAILSCATAAFADAPPKPPPPHKEAHEDRKEVREDRKERREDKKELAEDKKDGAGKKEIADDKKELAKDRKEIHSDRKELRPELRAKREARIKEFKAKWGDAAHKPAAVDQLKLHAQRMAHLRRIRTVAESKGKTAEVARVDKIMAREDTRFQKALTRIKGEG
jgi:hypothetical protein